MIGDPPRTARRRARAGRGGLPVRARAPRLPEGGPVRARGRARLPGRGARAAPRVPARRRRGDGRVHVLRPPREDAGDRPRGRPRAAEPPGAAARRARSPREGDALVAGNICNTWAYDPADARRVGRASCARCTSEQVALGASRRAPTSSSPRRNDYLGEALIAVEVIREAGLPSVVDVRLDRRDRRSTASTFDEACRRLEAAGADVVGLNCSRGPATMLPLLERDPRGGRVPRRRAAGAVPHDARGSRRSSRCATRTATRAFPIALDPFTCTRFEMADFAVAARDLGVGFIGVCCGGAPHHVRAMAEALGRTVPASRYSPDLALHPVLGDTPALRGDAGHANICSMTAQGSARARFRRALRGGDAFMVVTAAHQVENMSVTEAFAVVLVLATRRDPRRARAARRLARAGRRRAGGGPAAPRRARRRCSTGSTRAMRRPPTTPRRSWSGRASAGRSASCASAARRTGARDRAARSKARGRLQSPVGALQRSRPGVRLMSDESVLYTVARESTPLVALGDGWRAPAGSDTNAALSAAVEAARAASQDHARRAPRRARAARPQPGRRPLRADRVLDPHQPVATSRAFPPGGRSLTRFGAASGSGHDRCGARPERAPDRPVRLPARARHAVAGARPRRLRRERRVAGGARRRPRLRRPRRRQDPQDGRDLARADRRRRDRRLLRDAARGRGDVRRGHPRRDAVHVGRDRPEAGPPGRAERAVRTACWCASTIPANVAQLEEAARASGKPLGLLVDLEVGGGRTGHRERGRRGRAGRPHRRQRRRHLRGRPGLRRQPPEHGRLRPAQGDVARAAGAARSLWWSASTARISPRRSSPAPAPARTTSTTSSVC